MDKKSLASNYRSKLMKKFDRANELKDNTTALEKTEKQFREGSRPTSPENAGER
jgi:uncharacterized protein YjcR